MSRGPLTPGAGRAGEGNGCWRSRGGLQGQTSVFSVGFEGADVSSSALVTFVSPQAAAPSLGDLFRRPNFSCTGPGEMGDALRGS